MAKEIEFGSVGVAEFFVKAEIIGQQQSKPDEKKEENDERQDCRQTPER